MSVGGEGGEGIEGDPNHAECCLDGPLGGASRPDWECDAGGGEPMIFGPYS